MKRDMRVTTALLGILGLGDLAMVPFMIAAHQHPPGQPPVPAIAAVALIGIATLASARGAAQGRRRAFRVALACRLLDSISALLGLAVRPSAMLVALSAVTLVLSVAAIILLVRLNPRRTRRAAGLTAGQEPESARRPAQ
jgi:O-antigen/teichoic acid export membrane protein